MSRDFHVRASVVLATAEIADRIARDNPAAADRFVAAVKETGEFLRDFPESGDVVATRKRRLRGLRLWQVKGFRNYLILYRTTKDAVEILTVFHGARNLPWILRGL
jgi:toxin ParE1/3/4